jgi:hypothetical protein
VNIALGSQAGHWKREAETKTGSSTSGSRATMGWQRNGSRMNTLEEWLQTHPRWTRWWKREDADGSPNSVQWKSQDLRCYGSDARPQDLSRPYDSAAPSRSFDFFEERAKLGNGWPSLEIDQHGDGKLNKLRSPTTAIERNTNDILTKWLRP